MTIQSAKTEFVMMQNNTRLDSRTDETKAKAMLRHWRTAESVDETSLRVVRIHTLTRIDEMEW